MANVVSNLFFIILFSFLKKIFLFWKQRTAVFLQKFYSLTKIFLGAAELFAKAGNTYYILTVSVPEFKICASVVAQELCFTFAALHFSLQGIL